MISTQIPITQIPIYTIYNTFCDSNVVVHRFIRKALCTLINRCARNKYF